MFADLDARTDSSDFFISFTIKLQFSLSSCGPSTRGDMKTSQGPGRRLADVHGFFDTVASQPLTKARPGVLPSTRMKVSAPHT